MPLLWMPCKSFYGRLSSILNNCDRGKTVTFNGLIHEICYAVPAEWVEPLYRTTAFHGLKSAGIIHTEVSIFCIMSRSGADFSICHGADRSGYSLTEKVTDFYGADIRHRDLCGLLRSGYPSDGFFHGADCPLRRANRTNPLRLSTQNRIKESVILDGYPRMLTGFLLISETNYG